MRNDDTGKVTLVAGAFSCIGARSIRALAPAGHTVYAGAQPLRSHMDPSRDGSEVVSAVAHRVRVGFSRRIGPDSLLIAGSSLHLPL